MPRVFAKMKDKNNEKFHWSRSLGKVNQENVESKRPHKSKKVKAVEIEMTDLKSKFLFYQSYYFL